MRQWLLLVPKRRPSLVALSMDRRPERCEQFFPIARFGKATIKAELKIPGVTRGIIAPRIGNDHTGLLAQFVLPLANEYKRNAAIHRRLHLQGWLWQAFTPQTTRPMPLQVHTAAPKCPSEPGRRLTSMGETLHCHLGCGGNGSGQLAGSVRVDGVM